MDIQQQITNEVDRAEAAYLAFRRLYIVQNPIPEKEVYQSDNRVIQSVLGVILVSSMIVSGSHTIPTFSNGASLPHMIVGFAAFCMLELTLAAFAFVGTQRHYRVEQSEPKSFKWFIFAGVAIPFAVMILGNIDDTFHSRGITMPQELKVIILLGVGLSGPLLAFIVGDVLAMYSVIDRVQRRRHDKTYQEIIREWEDGLNRKWSMKAADFGGRVKVTVEPVQAIHSLNSLNRVNEQSEQIPQIAYSSHSANGYTKRMDAKEVIRQFFVDHPEHMTTRLDDIVPMIQDQTGVKVGRTSVHNVRKEMTQ